MNGMHYIMNVQQLHDDGSALYKNVVMGSADQIISDLENGITILKSAWEGKDASVQINNIIEVCNAMIDIRNALGGLAVDSTKVASQYRDIQNANKANLPVLEYLRFDNEGAVSGYSDTRDTISITSEAENGKQRIDAANENIEKFIADTRTYMDLIMNNWRSGPGRGNAQEAFSAFLEKANKYRETLSEASNSISTAIRNYSF